MASPIVHVLAARRATALTRGGRILRNTVYNSLVALAVIGAAVGTIASIIRLGFRDGDRLHGKLAGWARDD